MKDLTVKRFVCILIVATLVRPAGLSAKDRKGADIVVTKTDGSQFGGELIAVKRDSLLLLSAGMDLSIRLADIREVRVVRKSHALLFAGIGAAAGATVGAFVGIYGGGGDDDVGPATIRGAVVIGALGAVAGLLTSSVFSRDSRFDVAGGRQEAVAEFWDSLRSYSREGRLPGAQVKPAALQAGLPSLRTWPRFRISVAGSLVRPTEHLRLPGGTFRFPEEAPPEAGPYPFLMEYQAGPHDAWAGTLGPVSLAYDWSDRWSVEIEGSRSPATMGSMDGTLRFTSSLDGREYVASAGESRQLSYASLLAGLTYRLLSPSAFSRHSIEAGAAVGPAFVSYTLMNVLVVRKTAFCGRFQAAYDYSIVPAVSVGAFAGYRFMKTTIPGDVLPSLIVFQESGNPSGGTLERPTEIRLPDLSIDGSGGFMGLRIGFRF
jgi:hypothetical protein